MRHSMLGLLAVVLFPLQGLCTYLTITTDPSPPEPNQPFEITVSGSVGRYKFIDPTLEVRNGIIRVALGRDCGFLTCDPPRDDSFTLRSGPLPPGNYVIVATEWLPGEGIGGVLPVKIGSVAPDVYRGLWWTAPAGSESGWGLSIEHQGDTLFAVWFTYDPTAPNTPEGLHSGMWLVMPNAVKTGNATFSGDLYRTVGSAINSVEVTMRASIAGKATLSFSDGDNGVFTYTLNDIPAPGYVIGSTKILTRQVFSAPMPQCTPGTK